MDAECASEMRVCGGRCFNAQTLSRMTSNGWLLGSTLRNTPNVDAPERATLHPRGLMIIRKLDTVATPEGRMVVVIGATT